jgi:hypothetical protein
VTVLDGAGRMPEVRIKDKLPIEIVVGNDERQCRRELKLAPTECLQRLETVTCTFGQFYFLWSPHEPTLALPHTRVPS